MCVAQVKEERRRRGSGSRHLIASVQSWVTAAATRAARHDIRVAPLALSVSRSLYLSVCPSLCLSFSLLMCLSMLGGIVVSILDCQSRVQEFKCPPGQTFHSMFLLHLHPLANSEITNTALTYTVSGKMRRIERTGHSPTYAEGQENEVGNT